MTLPDEDLEELRRCRVGDCKLKVTEELLEQIQKDVDWSSPDAHERATEWIRKRGYEYTLAYQEGGNRALAVYRDKKRPTFIATELEELLNNTHFLPLYLPELHEYLLEYPDSELPDSVDFFYWAENDFGLKPVVRLSHVTIYRPPGVKNSAAIASKQLYASHYFHTALELRLVLEDPARPGAGFYLLSLNRSRSDGLSGFTGTLIRGRVKERTRAGQEKVLQHTKQTMESDHRGQRISPSYP
jgi:hypothetical protein